MSEDTAQPLAAADPNTQLANAADAFKSFLNPPDPQPRGDDGKFVSTADEPEDDEPEIAQPGDVEESEDDQVDDDKAAEEAQPEALDMPSSWSKEDAEVWTSLPPETQAKIAEREGQRETAVNLKFQEAANIRKANEAIVNEANANRDRYAAAIDEVLSLVTLEEPNPVDYGLGTDGYNREAYDLAVYQHRQAQQTVTALQQQRQDLAAQQAEEAERVARAAHAEIEAVGWPKFLGDVPDLADPAKGSQIVRDVVDYAKKAGIPDYVFDDPQAAKSLTSVELHIAWKAMQYDRIKEAEKRVKAGNPPPKPAQPAIKPGGIATRQSVQKSRLNKAQDRLAREGSVEAGAAVFKHLFKGI